jgi:hypothetical protein
LLDNASKKKTENAKKAKKLKRMKKIRKAGGILGSERSWILQEARREPT